MVVFETVHQGELIRVRREGAKLVCEALSWTARAIPSEILAHVVRAVAQEQRVAPERVQPEIPTSAPRHYRVKRRSGIVRKVADWVRDL